MNSVTLQTFRGINEATGDVVDWDLDEVLVNGQRVGFVPHQPEATFRLVRFMTEPTIKEVHAEVVRQRAEQGKPSVADHVSRLPTPEAVASAVRRVRKSVAL